MQDEDHTDQITYAGYHPNDSAKNWLGGIPYLSSPTIFEFFNNFTAENQELIHGVNRLELLGRNSAGTFLLQILEKVDGISGPWVLTEVHRVDRLTQQSHGERTITKFAIVSGDPVIDTKMWLETGYEALRTLDQSLGTSFALPADGSRYFDDYEDAFPGPPPSYINSSYTDDPFEPSSSSEEPFTDDPQMLSDFGGYAEESIN